MNRACLTSLLIRHEGLKLRAYFCPAGKITVGVGRNLEDRGITQEEALFMLDNDIDDIEADLRKSVRTYQYLSDARQDVLICMAFNMGLGGLKKFKKFLAAIEVKDFDAAANEMLASRWAGQVGARASELARMMKAG